MGAVDSTSIAAFLKEAYSADAIKEIAYENPALALLQKKSVQSAGKYYVQPILYSLGGTASASLSAAQAGQGAPLPEDFQVPFRELYDERVIKYLTMLQSKGDKTAFADAVTVTVDAMLANLSHQVALQLYRNHGGSVGVVASLATTTVANDTITLVNADDVSNFHVGMQVQASSTDGTSGTVTATVAEVIAVNRDSGIVIVNATIPGIAAAWNLFPSGTFGSAIHGYKAWCPPTAPTSTAFLGVDRSVDSRLGGSRISATSLPVNVAIRNLQSRMARDGAYPDTCFISPTRFNTLIGELFGKVVFCDVKSSDAQVSFSGIAIPGGKGTIKVVQDHNCPQDMLALFVSDALRVIHAGDMFHVWNQGGQLQMSDTYAGYRVRASCFANLSVRAPWELGIATF